MKLNIVVFGLSITSSWGNGHATTYRALLKALARRGHHITFMERDVPWYRAHRDFMQADYCDIALYSDLPEAGRRFTTAVRDADLVIIGSYVPDGIALGDWITREAQGITAFYDIDTPVTLSKLEAGAVEYLTPALIPRFDLFLSFTGGPTLRMIEEQYGSPRARALYCAADADLHAPTSLRPAHALGYLGTYSADRQPALERLLFEPARALPSRSFAVAGAQFPEDIAWPANVTHSQHVPPQDHAAFYGAQEFTLNLTRADMVRLGYSPSVRLFEAAACGVPIISDTWPGIETFFRPNEEIVLVETADDVVGVLRDMPDARRRAIGAAARRRMLASHTADHRARELEGYYREALSTMPASAEVVA